MILIADFHHPRLLLFAKRVVTSEYLSLVLRIFIGIISIKASIWKIVTPKIWLENLAAYEIIPFELVNFFAVVIPSVELICGIFLIIGLRTRAAAAFYGLFILLITMGITVNLLRKRQINCGCFSPTGEPISLWKVFKNIFEVIILAQIFFFDRIIMFRRIGFQFFNR